MSAHFTKRNPWFILVPLLALLWGTWAGYLYLTRETNAVSNSLLPGGSFDDRDSTGFPAYWTIESHGKNKYHTSQTTGHDGGAAFKIRVMDYRNGDVSVISRKIPIPATGTFLFKGFYFTTAPFDLFVRYYHSDGTSSMHWAKSYPFQGDPWSTVSTAFRGDPSITDVQFIYHLHSAGSLELDDTYLTRNTVDILLPPNQTLRSNLLADSATNNSDASAWRPYQMGDNTALLQKRLQKGNQYLHTEISHFKSGEAKWQSEPLATTAGRAYTFGVDYRSTAPALIIAETVLKNGQRTFTTLRALPVSSQWVRYEGTFEAPKNAQSFFISAVLQQQGSIDTDNYGLHETTHITPRQFRQPLVSITFDDGWETDYQRGAKALNAFGYRGTFYLNPSSLDTNKFMTTLQIHELARAGHQLASHGFEHKDMTTLGQKTLRRELRNARSFITQQTTDTAVDFASPYGKTDPEVSAVIQQYYRSHRGTEDGINTKQNFDRYNLRVLFMGSETTLANLQDALTAAKEHNGWLILVYHSVNDTPVNSNAVPQAKLRAQLQTIQDNGLKVDTVQAALHELLAQL